MLDIRSLHVHYNDKPALVGVSLNLKAGEILSIVGPNGAGKTTLIRAISGVTPVRSGSISFDGNNFAKLSPPIRARYVAVVPQARNLPPSFTVYQAVLLGRTPHLGWLGQTGPRDHQLVEYALESTKLEEIAERRVGELSGGEQQRVLLARALVQKTPVLLLDEPTTHLDLHNQSTLLNMVKTLAEKENCVVLMVLHDLNMAALYSDRVALLSEGRLQKLGTPQEVLTEENLREVYSASIHVIPHPLYGTPLVLPDGRESLGISDGQKS